MFKSFAITLCRVYITQKKISKRCSCDICAFLNSLYNWESFWICVLSYVCCVCVFLLHFWCSSDNSPTWNSIFATNGSQIWAFSEDLITYLLSLKNCNTICKRRNKNYKIITKIIIFFKLNLWWRLVSKF